MTPGFKNHFIITGLPRSRTAWLANLLTNGRAFCHHELLNRVEPERLRSQLDKRPEFYVGDSEPLLPLYYNAVMQQIPNAAVVVVQRPIEDARASYARVVVPYVGEEAFAQSWEQLIGHWTAMLKAMGNRRALRVKYADLDDEATVRAIWEHCAPRLDWDHERWQMLDVLRVTASAEKISPRVMHPEWKPAAITTPREEPVESSQVTPTMQAYLDMVQEILSDCEMGWLWFNQLMEVMLVWDHLEDNDALDKPMMNRVFEALTLDWPRNNWWEKNKFYLLPVLATGLSDWRNANNGGDPRGAYTLYIHIALALAYIVGGPPKVQSIEAPLRKLMERERTENNERKEKAVEL